MSDFRRPLPWPRRPVTGALLTGSELRCCSALWDEQDGGRYLGEVVDAPLYDETLDWSPDQVAAYRRQTLERRGLRMGGWYESMAEKARRRYSRRAALKP